MMKEKKIFQQLNLNDVCQVYNSLLEDNLVSFPLNSEAQKKIESIVGSIAGSYFGNEIYKTVEEKAVAYLYFLIKDHPFVDGNKRTACLAFELICYLNKLKPNYGEFHLDAIAIFVEKIQDKDHQFVIKMLSGIIFGIK